MSTTRYHTVSFLQKFHLNAAKIDFEEARDWTTLDFLAFIAEWDFIESLSLTFQLA